MKTRDARGETSVRLSERPSVLVHDFERVRIKKDERDLFIHRIRSPFDAFRRAACAMP